MISNAFMLEPNDMESSSQVKIGGVRTAQVLQTNPMSSFAAWCTLAFQQTARMRHHPTLLLVPPRGPAAQRDENPDDQVGLTAGHIQNTMALNSLILSSHKRVVNHSVFRFPYHQLFSIMLVQYLSVSIFALPGILATALLASKTPKAALFDNSAHGQAEWSRYCSGSVLHSADLLPHACFAIHDDITSAAHSSSEPHLGFASASGHGESRHFLFSSSNVPSLTFRCGALVCGDWQILSS